MQRRSLLKMLAVGPFARKIHATQKETGYDYHLHRNGDRSLVKIDTPVEECTSEYCQQAMSDFAANVKRTVEKAFLDEFNKHAGR